MVKLECGYLNVWISSSVTKSLTRSLTRFNIFNKIEDHWQDYWQDNWVFWVLLQPIAIASIDLRSSCSSRNTVLYLFVSVIKRKLEKSFWHFIRLALRDQRYLLRLFPHFPFNGNRIFLWNLFLVSFWKKFSKKVLFIVCKKTSTGYKWLNSEKWRNVCHWKLFSFQETERLR